MRTVLVLNGPNLNRPAVMGRCPDPAGNLGRQLGTSHHFAATSGVSATNSPAGQLPSTARAATATGSASSGLLATAPDGTQCDVCFSMRVIHRAGRRWLRLESPPGHVLRQAQVLKVTA